MDSLKQNPNKSDPAEIWQQVSLKLMELGLPNHGFTELKKPLTLSIYQDWLEKGYAGEMDYLSKHLQDKAEPQRLLPRALSAIVVTKSYVPHPKPVSHPVPNLRIAKYAQGEDYHHWFRSELNTAADELSASFPGEKFVSFTDSHPVLERDLAFRAGQGWIGKNTCLIHPKRGSLFFIGEIYTTLGSCSEAVRLPDFCGTCTRCMDICPTQAIVAPRELNATKCISYLTIEARANPPMELRSGIGDWLFGCDLCQTVCPWNRKWVTQADPVPSAVSFVEEDIRYILLSSNKKLERDFAHTALSRAAGVKLKRNAIVVIANLRLKTLADVVQVYTTHPKLNELAAWCLQILNSEDDREL